jgi:DNA repair exonuclease SbcCD ATPase subunit
MSSNRRGSHGNVAVPDADLNAIFEEAQAQFAGKEESISRMERFEEQIGENPDLFDEEDMNKLKVTLNQRRQEIAGLSQRFRMAMELYKTTVSDLESKISRRQLVLEQIDAAIGAVSKEPDLLEYFGKKQALYATTVIDARKLLCTKIREILVVPA